MKRVVATPLWRPYTHQVTVKLELTMDVNQHQEPPAEVARLALPPPLVATDIEAPPPSPPLSESESETDYDTDNDDSLLDRGWMKVDGSHVIWLQSRL